MKTLLALVAGVGVVLTVPTMGRAVCSPPDVLHEGHFSGHSAHAPSGPGVFPVGETFTAYTTLDVTQVNPWYPFDDANYDYTLVLSGTSASYVNMPIGGGNTLRMVDFTDASFAIYEDAATTADYANTATFTDGLAILSGVITGMHAEGVVNGATPENLGVTGTATITGGAAMGSVPCLELAMNDFFAWLPATSPAGFQEAYGPKWECCVPATGADPSTWGGVKSLYR
jgi:hypothetical protein